MKILNQRTSYNRERLKNARQNKKNIKKVGGNSAKIYVKIISDLKIEEYIGQNIKF